MRHLMRNSQMTRMMQMLRRTGILLLCLATAASRASAQTGETSGSGSPSLLTVSVGIPAANGETARELYTIGVQWTQWKPGRLALDLAAGTMPRLLANNVLGIGLRGGAALPLEITQGVYLLPSAGVSVIAGAGGGGADGAYGPHLGLAGVLLGQNNLGLRAGATWNRFREARNGVWLLELGVAFRR